MHNETIFIKFSAILKIPPTETINFMLVLRLVCYSMLAKQTNDLILFSGGGRIPEGTNQEMGNFQTRQRLHCQRTQGGIYPEQERSLS